ncbi:MAG TPA: ABC transporter permease [Candidatus Hydrogenedentes bacterium]|nr:ABC transporter permease [Candidatus Hydrogenedentota bacterium]
MLHRVWVIFIVELQKTMRLKHTLAGPFLLGILILCAPLLHPVSRQSLGEYDQIANQGYALIAFITPRAMGVLAFLFTLLFSAALISPELHSGNIRQIFIRPLHRYEFVIGKLLLGCSYAILLLMTTVALSWGTAYALCHLSGSRLAGITFGGELLYTATQMRNAYLIGFLLSMAPLFATAAFGLMISSMTRNTVQAISLAIGSWILVDALKYPLRFDRFVFFSYLEKPWQGFIQQCSGADAVWFPMTWECLAVSITTTLLCTAVAILITWRRDVSA